MLWTLRRDAGRAFRRGYKARLVVASSLKRPATRTYRSSGLRRLIGVSADRRGRNILVMAIAAIAFESRRLCLRNDTVVIKLFFYIYFLVRRCYERLAA